MNNKTENTILQIIKYTPPFFIISLAIIIFITLYLNHKKIFYEEKINIQKDFIKKNKNDIKSKVDRIYTQIKFQQSNTEAKLKENLKSRVYEAYSIALNIYNENKHLEKEKIQKMIKDALRNIRFNNGRGYFFIYSFDYKCILLPVAKHLEGSSFYNFKDGKGTYITRDIITQMRKKKEGFQTWWYHKPYDVKNQYKKLGFNKYFEPLNWFIGTGEYIDDFENDIKKDVLKRLDTLKFKNNGYIFALDFKGTYLSHIKKEIVGLNAIEAKDTKTNDTIIKAINLTKNQGNGFLSYIQNKKPGTDQASKKISYIRAIPEWKWFIGYGFYEDDFKQLVKKEETILNKRFKDNLNSLLITTFILTIILLSISIYISKLLKKRFKTYNNEITKQQYMLSQQSKMAAIGTMIGNIAHQWRQPLSIISTAATGASLKKELGILEDKELIESLDSINKSTQYLSKTIDDFRNFFLSNKEKKDFYINEAIQKSLNLVDAQFKNNNISVIFNSVKVVIYGIETELIQVLINILNNAKDELIKFDDYERLIFIDTTIEENFVKISIKDNAGGIPEEILEHVFEPYFTTKHKSQGTGIGLYMSREIVVKHLNGSINIKNTDFIYQKKKYKGAEVSLVFELLV